mmetsp:Transcript_45850/g.76280  ORF Transcript_45850/g.76280 Transcript_45850/m.76280 type:complete len:268 (-) Transcript_45850:28-831(-)
MQMVPNARHKCLPGAVRCNRNIVLFHERMQQLINALQVFRGRKQVWNLATVEQVVDILQEPLVNNLSIVEQEHRVLTFATGTQHQLFHILAKRRIVVAATQLNLYTLVLHNKAGQSSERLSTRTAYTNQHCVAAWLTQNARNPQQMFHSVIKKHQIHRRRTVHIVIVEIARQNLVQQCKSSIDDISLVFVVVIGFGGGTRQFCIASIRSAFKKVAPHNWILHKQLLLIPVANLKMFAQIHHHGVGKPLSILVTNQTIMKTTHTLVYP